MKNIRSYEQQVIDFPEGSLLLAGDVGAGKTTMLLAIEYALFGLQPGQKGSALLRNNAQLGEVALEFEINDCTYTIERHLKRETKSIVSDYAALTQDGETREYSVTELKSKVLDILGYPTEFIKKNNLLYRYTVYTPQEQMKQIILEDAETRLNVLRHIFGIDKYKRIRENAVMVINRLKEETKVLQGEVKTIEHDKNRRVFLTERIKILANDEKEKEQQLCLQQDARARIEKDMVEVENKMKERAVFEKEVEKTTIFRAMKQEALMKLTKEQQELMNTIEEAGPQFNNEKYTEVLVRVQNIQQEQDALNAAYVALLGQVRSLEQMQKEQLEKKERIFRMDICPACLQDVPEVHKHNILNETEGKLVEVKKQRAELAEKNQALNNTLEAKKRELQQLEREKLVLEIQKSRVDYLEKTRQKALENKKQQEELEKDAVFLAKHLEQLKAEILTFSKFETQYRAKQEELRNAAAIEKNTEIALAELRRESVLTKQELAALQEVITQKEQLEKKLARLMLVVEWLGHQFSDLINFTEVQVLLKLRREFSRVFNAWFHMVAGESFEVQLDENFTPVILQGDVEMEYAFLSGGERTAVALAYRLALNQTINSVLSQIKTKDLVILDEPTDGFSEAQIDKIRDVLEELNVKQLIIVSHEPKIEGFVDNVTRVRKTGDVSEVDIRTFIAVSENQKP
ncbi:MAG TPA: AAA family ATPase [Candidatus Nanoarchaeia archaeon]|nr:AAA family ATPase [Candidatus Nanoarchaeia archaeon]